MTWSIRTFGLVASLVLAGCGGGGGGGGGGGSSAPTTANALVITTSNSTAVAAEALQVSTNYEAASSGGGFVTAVQIDGASGSSNPMLLAKAARKLLSMAPQGASLATGVTVTETIACTSGSITVSQTSSGSATAAAGDQVSITANSCSEPVGDGTFMVMNGVMTITIVEANYDPASTVYPKSITMRIVAQNFSVTAGGETSVSNGDLTLSLVEHSAGVASITLTANTLTSSVGGHGVTLKNYSHKVDASGTGTVIQMSATVETTNSRLGSSPTSYTISTPTPIRLDASGAYVSGSVLVTGNGSAMLMTVTATNTFQVQVDGNGDGSYESSSTVTLSQLQAAL